MGDRSEETILCCNFNLNSRITARIIHRSSMYLRDGHIFIVEIRFFPHLVLVLLLQDKVKEEEVVVKNNYI